jgi:hypothetical protein
MVVSMKKRLTARALFAVLLAVCLTGCFPWPRPTWSPDGKQVAFLAEDGIWTAERGTRELRPLYRSARIISGAAWAPDGSALYCLEASTDCRKIVLQRVPADGGPATAIHAFESEREIVHEMVIGEDGLRIALDMASHPSVSLLALELLPSEDGPVLQVFDVNARRTVQTLGLLRGPRWSPDGKMLACIRTESEEAGREVVVFAVDGTTLTEQRSIPIGDEDVDSDHPAHLSWSSDSRRILTDDSDNVWLVLADGSKPPKKIAEGMMPSFVPGGTGYSLLQSGGQDELVLALRDPDSTNMVELARQSTGFMPSAGPQSWSPDGESHAGIWFPGAAPCPLLRVSDGNGLHWRPATVAQAFMLAASTDALAAKRLEEGGDVRGFREAGKEAVAAYEDLLKRSPDWTWRLPVELRCALLRGMLDQPDRDTGGLADRIARMPDGNFKEGCRTLMSALLLSRGKQEEAFRAAPCSPDELDDLRKKAAAALAGSESQRLSFLSEMGQKGFEPLFDGEPCMLGSNIFREARAPQQAIGPPDALGSEAAAWQPSDDAGAQWLEVSFDPPAKSHGLSIVQSPVPGGVVTVDLIGPDGASLRVLKPSDKFDGNLEFPITPWPVHSARIYTRSKDPYAPNGIDAVKLRSPQGDRWATGARGSEGRSDPLPQVPMSQRGKITNRLDRFTLTLTSAHGAHVLNTANGSISLPEGKYSLGRLRVEEHDAQGTPWSLTGSAQQGTVIRVEPGAAAGFSCGFPLKTAPVLSLRKGSLSISAALQGAQGQKYKLSGLRRGGSSPPAPAFKVHGPDGAVVHSGKLEYG